LDCQTAADPICHKQSSPNINIFNAFKSLFRATLYICIERRAVITKNADFVNSLLISKRPYKLLLVSTGNKPSRELGEIFVKKLSAIVAALMLFDYMELTRRSLIEHG